MNGGMRVAAYEKSKSVKLKSISTMTEGTIWRQIFLFSIPLILGNLLQQMYNTVDSIIVGNFVGSNALAAVGSSTSLICLLIAFSMGASAGAGVIVSQFYGAGDENGVQRSAHTALMLALQLQEEHEIQHRAIRWYSCHQHHLLHADKGAERQLIHDP